MNEVEYLRKDRDRWLEAWRQVVRSAEETRLRYEVEKAALLECIKKQDARITDLETRRTMLREQVEGERTMRLELHEDIDCVLARMESRAHSCEARFESLHLDEIDWKLERKRLRAELAAANAQLVAVTDELVAMSKMCAAVTMIMEEMQRDEATRKEGGGA